MNKVMIVGATHGHEHIGVKINEELGKHINSEQSVSFTIGNPRAYEKNVPFIESDLNRIFPGLENGDYEESRAHELLTLLRSHDLVIDIHSTKTTDLGDQSMIIITEHTDLTKKIVDLIKPPKVLIMKYNSQGALISHAKNGIAFEYGKDESSQVFNATLSAIYDIFVLMGILHKNPKPMTWQRSETEVFEVTGVLDKDVDRPFTIDPAITNFKLVTKGSLIAEYNDGQKVYAPIDFYPVLFGKNRYHNIFGFTAQKI